MALNVDVPLLIAAMAAGPGVAVLAVGGRAVHVVHVREGGTPPATS